MDEIITISSMFDTEVYFSKKFVDDLQADIKRYKQILEEIREITEQDRNCMNSELACCQLCDKLDLIKDKINEILK